MRTTGLARAHTRKLIWETIRLREDELDIVEKYALYEGVTNALLDGPDLRIALARIKKVWETVHTSAAKRRATKQ